MDFCCIPAILSILAGNGSKAIGHGVVGVSGHTLLLTEPEAPRKSGVLGRRVGKTLGRRGIHSQIKGWISDSGPLRVLHDHRVQSVTCEQVTDGK